ncbi:MAG: desulfoferrodoxin FeS4 iron-binding domain-containing protein [Candidatus Brocadiales bacterium]
MTETGEKYYCEVCGAEVEVVAGGAGTLVCCDQPMTPKSD